MQNPNNKNLIVLHPLLEPFMVLCLTMINAISKVSLFLFLIGIPPISLEDMESQPAE